MHCVAIMRCVKTPHDPFGTHIFTSNLRFPKLNRTNTENNHIATTRSMVESCVYGAHSCMRGCVDTYKLLCMHACLLVLACACLCLLVLARSSLTIRRAHTLE